jgi:hypothetical protein
MDEIYKLVEEALRLHQRHKAEPWLAQPSKPILYFGNRKAYEKSDLQIVTVSKNPSLNEFPKHKPYERFPLLRDFDMSNSDLDQQKLEIYLK